MEPQEKNKIENGTLYLVGTPIGNMADLSERAIKTLRDVDFIAAEDTRNTLRLISLLGIKKELVSYHEHNKKSAGEYLIGRLKAGESCALVTDAGMPAISDPGEDIVRLCASEDVPVHVVPGPCAAVSALSLSALATGRFVFEGFLPMTKAERNERLNAIRDEMRTVILYEAPHKLKNTLKDLLSAFGGGRRISLCRELTKINEEVLRFTLSQAVDYYEQNDPRGEYVLILAGGAEDADYVPRKQENPLLVLSPADHVAHYERGGMAHKDAIKAAAKDRGMAKSDFYKLLIEEK